jgi:hypothetical protein
LCFDCSSYRTERETPIKEGGVSVGGRGGRRRTTTTTTEIDPLPEALLFFFDRNRPKKKMRHTKQKQTKQKIKKKRSKRGRDWPANSFSLSRAHTHKSSSFQSFLSYSAIGYF